MPSLLIINELRYEHLTGKSSYQDNPRTSFVSSLDRTFFVGTIRTIYLKITFLRSILIYKIIIRFIVWTADAITTIPLSQ